MATIQPERPDNGTLDFSPDSNLADIIVVYYCPTRAALAAAFKSPEPTSVKLAEVNVAAGILRIFPIQTLPRENFLSPKYRQVRSIEVPYIYWEEGISREFDGMLEGLPRGLTRDYQYGLGIPKEYQAIIEIIEARTECTEVVLSGEVETQLSGQQFIFSLEDFEAIRLELDRISGRAQKASLRVKQCHVHNSIAQALGLAKVDYKRGRHPIVQFLADEAAEKSRLTSDERAKLLETAVEEAKEVERDQSAFLDELRSSIELASLDLSIEKLTSLLSKRTIEASWQRLFRENPLILQVAFGYPVVLVQEQASIGGMQLTGKGEKVADFLVKNSMTNNLAIFEIKTPGAPLLQNTPHRGGLYGPSKALGEGVSQVLDQRYQLEKRLVSVKENSRLHELEQYSISACLVIGRVPEMPDKVKSFELIRNSFKNVEVLAYDELLEKMRVLRRLLADRQP